MFPEYDYFKENLRLVTIRKQTQNKGKDWVGIHSQIGFIIKENNKAWQEAACLVQME